MITKELIILSRFAKKLGVRDTTKLEDRIAFQKKIYLLQACGIDLGYVFGWDLYGPYSKSLAQDAGSYGDNKNEIDKAAGKLRLTEWSQQILKCTESLKVLPKKEKIKQAEWLELLSSLHYLALFHFETVFFKGDSKKMALVNKELLEKKPHLKQYKSLINQAWNRWFSLESTLSSV